ncbi:MAG: short-chain-enoyl-CoA hydratase [Syntrophomonadaceae bacterium]|nr:short-chain-enoyl-CoA hydratase [Syntrophomonadaceae bacterium]
MAYENLTLEKENRIAILSINRPKALNALNADTLLDIKSAVEAVISDPEIDVLIITGVGDKAFVAGADIAYMHKLPALEARAFAILGQQVFRLIETMDKPVIAAVNGFALGGGCELAMACDMRLASDKALFGQPEVGLGITPGYGGTQRLPRLIGEGRAKELIYSASNINAEEAYRVGLVNHIYPAESLMEEAKKLAKKISSKAPLAVRLSKNQITRGMQADIDTAMLIEADMFGLCFATEDQQEGMSAFLEKRKAEFKCK